MNRVDGNELIEIDLLQLLIELIDKIKRIAVTALVFMLLLGGFRFAKGMYKLRNPELIAEAEEKYEEELKSYESQMQLYDSQINAVVKSIEKNDDYMQESILMNLDVNHFYEAESVYYIDTGYQINPSLAYQTPDKTASVLETYASLLSSGNLYTYIQKNLEAYIPLRYLQELITVETDTSAGILRLKVIGRDEKTVRQALALLQTYFEEQRSTVSASVGEHAVSLVEISSFNGGDGSTETAAGETEGYSSESMRNTIADRQNQVIKRQQDMQKQLSDLQAKQKEIKEPGAPQRNVKTVLKASIKFAVLGLVLGLFCAGAWISFGFVGRNSVMDESEAYQASALTILGSMKRFPESGMLGKVKAVLAGDRERCADIQELCQLTLANLSVRSGWNSEHSILLVGSSQEMNAVIADQLRSLGETRVESGGDILQSAAAIQELAAAEELILVEKKGCISKRKLQKESKKLQQLNKKVWGIILL